MALVVTDNVFILARPPTQDEGRVVRVCTGMRLLVDLFRCVESCFLASLTAAGSFEGLLSGGLSTKLPELADLSPVTEAVREPICGVLEAHFLQRVEQRLRGSNEFMPGPRCASE